jgi:hypothetical protein
MGRIKRAAIAFGAFWWDFIVGEDWRIAAGVILALAATAALATSTVPVWWVLPVAVVGTMTLSLSAVVRNDR